MEWFSEQQAALAPYFFLPHPVAVAAVLAFGLFWSRIGPPLVPGRPGAWFGFVAGAAVFAVAEVWVRGEPTTAVMDLVTSNIDPARVADARPLTGIVEALIAGYILEMVKLVLMLLVVFAMASPREPRAATTAAAAPALGFAMFGANASLSPAIQQLPVDGDLVFPIVQQWLWIGLHLGTAYLLAKGWLTDRLGVYLLSAGLLHAAAVYTANPGDAGLASRGGYGDPGSGRAQRLLRRRRRHPRAPLGRPSRTRVGAGHVTRPRPGIRCAFRFERTGFRPSETSARSIRTWG